MLQKTKKKPSAQTWKPKIAANSLAHIPTLKATMGYYGTKDILHVMLLLGHRKIENTLLYVQLVNSIFQDINDEYVCKVAKTAQEAMQLIEVGFEYVTGEYGDGGKLLYSTPTPGIAGL